MVQGIRCKPHNKEEPCLDCRRERQTSKVLEFNGITKLNIPVPKILAAAGEAKLHSAVVIGFDVDGAYYFASSQADGGDIFWLLELTKKKLLEVEE